MPKSSEKHKLKPMLGPTLQVDQKVGSGRRLTVAGSGRENSCQDRSPVHRSASKKEIPMIRCSIRRVGRNGRLRFGVSVLAAAARQM